jgi:hypothetical protein
MSNEEEDNEDLVYSIDTDPVFNLAAELVKSIEDRFVDLGGTDLIQLYFILMGARILKEDPEFFDGCIEVIKKTKLVER